MEISYIGKTQFRNESQIFGIKQEDRRKHAYLIGKTGTGKSTLMKNMIIQDIQAGRGVAVIDPHGDLAQSLLDYIPNSRIPETVYFNPSDLEHPIGFNLLRQVPLDKRPVVASGVFSVFESLWGTKSWGPLLEHVLNSSLVALLDDEEATLVGMIKMLSDEKYQEKIVNNMEDPLVKSIWRDEFMKLSKKEQRETFSSTKNKVAPFLTSPAIRNILGQPKSTIDFKKIMDQGHIFIADLSKGKLGENTVNLLGALLVSQFQITAMERADIPEAERKDFQLYIDEFHNFTTSAFGSVLSEVRKYRLCLTLAHQYLEQLGDETKGAIFGNIGTLISFRVGSRDAQEISVALDGFFRPEDCISLPEYNIYLKLEIDGQASIPFSAETMPVLFPKMGLADKVIRISRERYGKDRAKVEEKINRFLGETENY